MKLHLKHFATHVEYEAYISGEGAVLPNVSICEKEGDVHFNPVPPADAIDLGLPSGRLWCSHNVGAETETDYGDYFMWGSITPDTSNTCDWAHAPFNNGSSSYDSTYFASVKDTVCPNGVLALEYDAARQIMGGNWRMPTRINWDELLSGTTNVWVTNYQSSGKNGRLFTSKTNGNTMFIPAAGYRDGSSFIYQSDFGFIWYSLFHTDYPYCSWKLFLDSGSCSAGNGNRCCGYSVRGVMKL